MNSRKRLFWSAIIAQVVGAQVFFWDALFDYQVVTPGAVVVGTPSDLAVAVLGLVIMQSAYWYARRLQPHIRFRHLLYWVMCFSVLARSVSFRERAGDGGHVRSLEAIPIRPVESDVAGFGHLRFLLL
jgi:hypothetical protein